MRVGSRLLARLGLLALGLASFSASAGPPRDKEEKDRPKRKVAAPAAAADFDFADDVFDAEMIAPEGIDLEPIDVGGEVGENLGATPGGVKNTNLVRALIETGQVPRPEQVSPAGLFSEHDLPLRAAAECEQLLCVNTEATDAGLVSDPDLHYLVQLGFSSSLKPSEFKRPPLNVVLVIDQSSSMAGRPLEVVQETARTVLGQLEPRDRVSLVSFEQRAQVHVASVSPDDASLQSSISSLYATGASHLDAGLYAAIELAGKTARRFDGSTRIMLFTDDRPTYGRDQASAFVEMVRGAASRGISVTTIGVGTRFDSAIAKEIAQIRGGNLLFFNDIERMRSAFESDFDTMVTELAHDLKLVVEPGPGMRVADVYGVPETAIVRKGNGIELSVETLFLSRKKGAIYFGLNPVGRPNLPRMSARSGMQLGQVRLTYKELSGGARFSESTLTTLDSRRTSPGLSRGRVLVDEAVALEHAAELYHSKGDRAGARTEIERVAQRVEAAADEDLAGEIELLGQLGALLR